MKSAAAAHWQSGHGPAGRDPSRLEGSAPSGPRTAMGGTPVLWPALASALLLPTAFPPWEWWAMAWLAPAGWCWIVSAPRLAGGRPYQWLYLSGLLYWLLTLQWVRLPHWSAGFGWVALCLYLGLYIPLFVLMSRRLVHGWKVPLALACAASWCGLEWLRSRLFSGFSMALLGHSQVTHKPLIQIADLGGAYAVGFLVMWVAATAAGVARYGMPASGRSLSRQVVAPCVAAGLLLLASLAYGLRALGSPGPDPAAPRAKILLIQGARDTTFGPADDPAVTLEEYRRLTRQAVRDHPDADLIVWPESMHTIPWLDVHARAQVPPEFAGQKQQFFQQAEFAAQQGQYAAGWFAREWNKAALVGCAALEFGPETTRRFNRALWLDPQGNPAGWYDKMHPVMFGEYVPLGDLFPWLYRLTPMGDGLTAGSQPLSVDVGGIRLSPSICYENTVPHLIRAQVRQLADQGENPHALVTLSNDGWFWGSSELDMHLACGVFRAVELRRPMLVAANTGFSAWIDAQGRLVARGPRRATGFVAVELAAVEPPLSLYQHWGDFWALGCLLLAATGAVSARCGGSG